MEAYKIEFPDEIVNDKPVVRTYYRVTHEERRAYEAQLAKKGIYRHNTGVSPRGEQIFCYRKPTYGQSKTVTREAIEELNAMHKRGIISTAVVNETLRQWGIL